MDKNRVEAFSDGVLAIAITLLVLGLVPPQHRPDELGEALVHQLPAFAAYVVSFAIIGIMWINHHTLFALLRKVDRVTLFLNLFLLGTIATLPYPTQLLADNLRGTSSDAHLAAFAYSATTFMIAMGFNLLWQRATRHPGLLRRPMTPEQIRSSRRRFGLGGLVYLAALGLSFVSAPAMLGLQFTMAVYYAFDQLAHAGGSDGDAQGSRRAAHEAGD
ncbi:MAG: TMEM175 family protein [Actinomycetota bacterium]|nr:TMEM175 family protein [Actinomycetota bacterium]